MPIYLRVLAVCTALFVALLAYVAPTPTNEAPKPLFTQQQIEQARKKAAEPVVAAAPVAPAPEPAQTSQPEGGNDGVDSNDETSDDADESDTPATPDPAEENPNEAPPLD